MDLLQLKYFCVLAKLEHMTRAAEELRIAQPSLSKVIGRLEKHVGVPLFDRHGRKIRLNHYGETFLQRVNRVFVELAEGERELNDMAGLDRGVVVIGTTTTRLLTELLCEFLPDHSGANVRIAQVSTQQAEYQLKSGELDLCISSPPICGEKIHCELLLTEELFLAVPANHRLAQHGHIPLKDVADDVFIGLTSDYYLRTLTNQLCERAGFQVNMSYEINDPQSILSLVRSGLGVALVPANWWHTDSDNLPVRLRIDEPVCRREIGMSWSDERYLSLAARTFRDFASGYFTHAFEGNREIGK